MSGYLFRIRKRDLSRICLLVVCIFFVRPEQTTASLSLSEQAKNPFDFLGDIPPDQLFLGMYTLHLDSKSLENRKFSISREINSGKFLKILWIILEQIHKILVN